MKKNLLFLSLLFSCFPLLNMCAQDVLEVWSATQKIATDQAGDYDWVLDHWQLDKGTTYLLLLPANLDGYYFGPDAKRLKVQSYEKKNGGWYVVTCGDMDDMDDFQAYSAYLVTPTVDTESITHITAGIKTVVAATQDGKQLLHTTVDHVATKVGGLQKAAEGCSIVYDLQGRKVNGIRKGETYIIDGNKITIQ